MSFSGESSLTMGSEEKLHLATRAEWNSLSSFIWLVFMICCSRLPWQTGKRLAMINVVHVHLATPSHAWDLRYIQRSPPGSRDHSGWCLPSTTSHTQHHYNTECHWLDGAHCCSHTCDADTAGKDGWGGGNPCKVPGLSPRPPPDLRPHSTSICPRGASVSQKPSPNPQRNAAALCERLNP